MKFRMQLKCIAVLMLIPILFHLISALGREAYLDYFIKYLWCRLAFSWPISFKLDVMIDIEFNSLISVLIILIVQGHRLWEIRFFNHFVTEFLIDQDMI